VPRATAMFVGLPAPIPGPLANERCGLNQPFPFIHSGSEAGPCRAERPRNFRTVPTMGLPPRAGSSADISRDRAVPGWSPLGLARS
jgi:hypothetical protein